MAKKDIVATFSIVARDPETEELGIAVQSKYLAVGSVVPWAKAGIGAIATQALTNPLYGNNGLELLTSGKYPSEVINILTTEDSHSETRQLGIVDASGRSATFTGAECFEWAGGYAEKNIAIQGNIIESEKVINNMLYSYKNTDGPLADRLLAVLFAGQKAGGDRRGRQSAALKVVKKNGGYRGFNDRYIDLRVDDHKTPIKELRRLLDIFYLYYGENNAKNIEIKNDIVKVIKISLNVLSYYSGEINDIFDRELKESLETFYYYENFDDRDIEAGYIPEDIFNYLKEKSENIK